MNKLILIGNGFDLAHGLPTSYSDFINDFWQNIHLNYKEGEYKEIVYINEEYDRIFNYSKQTENYNDFISNLKAYSDEYNCYFDEHNHIYRVDTTNSVFLFKFKNDFFKKINVTNSLQNWVDIENEYYKSLKEIAKSSSLKIQEKKKRVTQLNKEFKQVKKLLEKYLIEKVYDKYELTSGDFERILNPISLFNNNHNLLDEFSNLEDKKEIEQLLEKEKKGEKHNSITYYLIFNYLPTPDHYLNELNKSFEIRSSYIHGFIKSEKFPINFGFGDEMDEDYKLIENLDENEFLKYFKSFQYSNTKYYSELLNYINAKKFQAVIMGHSCGLSDRLLLNTIFEHENCRSIKVYYHEKDSETDNYTTIIQNISRHFKDKQKMRAKIVNKELCRPLPQTQLPLRKQK